MLTAAGSLDASCFADLTEFADPEAAARRTARRVIARAKSLRTRIEMRRAKSAAELATLLPARIADGDSWHVISGGDIDALSYVAHILEHEPFERMLLSTWCMAAEDVAQLARWLDAGTLRWLDVYTGEIFPSQYAEAFQTLCAHVRRHRGRVATFRNHSKVTLLANHSTGRHLVIESSANVNTNPRTEQTAITASEPLFRFYDDFFAAVRSYNRNFDDWQRHGGANGPAA